VNEPDPYQPAPGDTLLFENERVRVWSMTVEPGNAGSYHQHRHDHVIIWPAAGRSRGQNLGDAEPGIRQDAQAGFVLYKTVGHAPGMPPHRLHNVDQLATTHYIVELLEPSTHAGEQPWQHNDRGEFVVD
jgi:hypothetical protein